MRTILVAFFTLVIAIISLPFLLIELIIRLLRPMAAAKFAQFIARIVFKFILFLSGAKKIVIGRENVPTNTPVLYTANHRSFYDILLAYSEVPTQTAFVSKKEIKKFPLVAQWMFFLNCLFIDRDDMKQQMRIIKSCISYVKDGYSIYIAPEGTRNTADELLPFKEGSFRISHKTGCPVIPVCILNTEALFENALPWIKKGTIIIEFGNPIYPDTLEPDDKKHLGAYVQKQVAHMYQKNIELLNKKESTLNK